MDVATTKQNDVNALIMDCKGAEKGLRQSTVQQQRQSTADRQLRRPFLASHSALRTALE